MGLIKIGKSKRYQEAYEKEFEHLKSPKQRIREQKIKENKQELKKQFGLFTGKTKKKINRNKRKYIYQRRRIYIE